MNTFAPPSKGTFARGGDRSRLTVAVLDANVLYPPVLRDLFLWLAVEKAFQPKWTQAIHDEWIENLLEDRPELSRVALLRTRDLMNEHGGDCLVEGYGERIETLTLPDADDRHILAAAIASGATTIVTFNLRDFPATVLQGYGIIALPPDPFVCSLYAAAPDAVVTAAWGMREALKKPPKTRDEYLDGLRRNQLTHFAEIMETQL